MSDEARWMRSLKRAYLPVVVALFVLAWLKGFRFPNLWSATHFAFNYSQGFVRRGLVGEVARQLWGDDVYRYETFVVFAFVVFFFTVVGFAWAIRRALVNDPRDLGLKVAVLVFASSPGLVFFIHSIGYNDYFGILLVLIVLFLASRSRSTFALFYWVVLISIVSALIHEGLAVMFGPILVLAMVCHVLRRAEAAPMSRGLTVALVAHTVAATLILLSLSTLVSSIGVEDLDRVQALREYVTQHADFPIRPKAFDALQRSSEQNLTRLMPWYWSVKSHVDVAIPSWQAFFPGFLWMLAYGVLAVRRARVPSSSRWILAVLFVLASLAPLAFNFVGWDWGRWNGLALLACFSSIMTLKSYFPTRAEDTTPVHVLSTGIIAVAIGLASTTPLFDGFQVEFFPFQAHQDTLERLIEDGFQYRPRG